MVINSEKFSSIELARQAAIQAAEAQDRKHGYEALRYECRTGVGRDYIYGQYEVGHESYQWISCGIEIK